VTLLLQMVQFRSRRWRGEQRQGQVLRWQLGADAGIASRQYVEPTQMSEKQT
jgi:hypothetical protein